MICNKCNHKLPDDSEFCQYCGSKIETIAVAEPVEDGLPDVDNMSGEDALKFIMATQVKATKEAYDANSQSQPNNENDDNFGLVPEKPIYTLARKSVDGEIEYLSKLRTPDGQKVKWNRRGSTSVYGVHGMIDIYDIYRLSGQKYCTIYINMYGAKKSTKAPNGFLFARPKTSAATPRNSVSTPKSNTTRGNSPSDKLVSFTNGSAIFLTFVSIFSIIVAMNTQDDKRNYYENWNTTTVYFVLLLILGIFAGFAINSFFKKKFKLISVLSSIPVLATIITSAEYSILSYYYYDEEDVFKYYINNDTVTIFNLLWITCVLLVLIITLVPVFATVIKKINNNWHKSISYREKCYKRVAKIHSYLEKGIITQEEYEKTKSDILKFIE